MRQLAWFWGTYHPANHSTEGRWMSCDLRPYVRHQDGTVQFVRAGPTPLHLFKSHFSHWQGLVYL